MKWILSETQDLPEEKHIWISIGENTQSSTPDTLGWFLPTVRMAIFPFL